MDTSDDEEDRLEIRPLRRPLLEEPTPRMRKPSERSPPTPPTLQLRRPSVTLPTLSPRPVSGLAAVAHTPPHFAQLTHPGPGPAAPPYLTTTSAVVTDLPHAAPTVGSMSSVKERLAQLQQGNLSFDDEPQTESTSHPDESPVNEKTSTTTITSDGKPISLENTRYALSPEAHSMIRRLSNGPPGLRRPSSPSPPMPSGWTRSDKITRTMQKQVMYRDLEQEAFESQQFSPMIIRPDSRNDYFVPDHIPANAGVEEDPFLSTYPKLNQELRRITKELNNVKKFSDPVADALQRLRERTGPNSPIANVPAKNGDGKFPLSGSWIKRFSPDRRDTSSPEPSSRKNSLPSRLKDTGEAKEERHEDVGVSVFDGEQESKLREITRQLWFSWPERPMTAEPPEESDDRTTEPDTMSQGTNSVSPTEVRDPRLQRVASEQRRSFGSGLRQTWGSALALAGLK